MRKTIARLVVASAALWGALTIAAGFALPPLLLNAPLPVRSEADRVRIRDSLCAPRARWARYAVVGGEERSLEVWWLHRAAPQGVAIILHGFGDDAWGTAPMANNLPELDAVVFTFRGRDRHPEFASTLGAWERRDVRAVVNFLQSQGTARSQIVFSALSQGAGIALLAMADLEQEGGTFGGALLESPFMDLDDAVHNHLRGVLGTFEALAWPAEMLALRRAGSLAHFEPNAVSPLIASRHVRTRVALLAGDADVVTPLAGVRAIAARHPDLTVVRGAGHMQAGAMYPGGFRAWARPRLAAWGFAAATAPSIAGGAPTDR